MTHYNILIGHWHGLPDVLRYLLHEVSSCISVVEPVLLLSQKQQKVSLVDVLGVVLKVAGYNIEPLHLVVSIMVVNSRILKIHVILHPHEACIVIRGYLAVLVHDDMLEHEVPDRA